MINLNIINMSSLPKVIYRIQHKPNQNLRLFLIETTKLILKFIKETTTTTTKEIKISKTILERLKLEDLLLR